MNRPRLAPLVLALALSLTAAPALVPVFAQKSTLAPEVARVSREPKVIVNQIQLAIREEKKALSGFESFDSEEALAQARQAATNAYVLVRAARYGVEDIKDFRNRHRKPADPILDLVFQKVDRAWNNARWPGDSYQAPGGGRARYLQESIQRMHEAVNLLEQVLYMWP
jgi:hypothetical protein